MIHQAGLASGPPRAYLGGMLKYVERFNLLRAGRDFQTFLATRRPYQFGFMAASLITCVAIVAGFIADSNIKREWKRPDIIYVQQWRADRTDAEIIAQQKIDQEKKKQRDAAQKKLEDENRAAFKRLNNRIGRWL